jgi:6-phosphogluconolactonase
MGDLYIGSYAKDSASGIYHFAFDTQHGTLSARATMAGISDPSFIALRPDGRSLIAVAEGGRGVVEIARDVATGALGAITSRQQTHGDWPCHVSVLPDGGHALVSNYGTGNLLCFPLPLRAHSALVQHAGSGPNADRQKGPHAHSAVITPDGRHAVVCDLGCDEVIVYAVSPDGALTRTSAVRTAAGAGPRHSAFHPDGAQLYVINELNSTLASFTWRDQRLTPLAVAPALPADFSGESYCSEIAVHPNGRYVYAANRGHNSIAVFQVQGDGSARPIAHESVRGDWPRHFALSPDGRWLLVANQRSGDVQVFGVGESGLLTYTGRGVRVPGAACICFNRRS